MNPLAVIGEVLAGSNPLPSWIGDDRALDQFILDFSVMAGKRDIPKNYVFEYMRDEVTGQSILHYMCVLERQGIPPQGQKRAALQALKGDWDKLDGAQQARYLDNAAPGAAGS